MTGSSLRTHRGLYLSSPIEDALRRETRGICEDLRGQGYVWGGLDELVLCMTLQLSLHMMILLKCTRLYPCVSDVHSSTFFALSTEAALQFLGACACL